MFTFKKIKDLGEVSLNIGFNWIFWLPNFIIALPRKIKSKYFLINEDNNPRLSKIFSARSDLYPNPEPVVGSFFESYTNIDRIQIHYHGMRCFSNTYDSFFLYAGTPLLYLFMILVSLLSGHKLTHLKLPYLTVGLLQAFKAIVTQDSALINFHDILIHPIKKIFKVDEKDSFGITDLQRAIFQGDINWVKKLLKRGADVNLAATKNAVNLVPYTAVDLAASLKELRGGQAVYDIIMRHILSIPSLKKYEKFNTTLRETCKFPPELSEIVYEYAQKEVNTFKANTEKGKNMLSLYSEKQRNEEWNGWSLVEQKDLDAEEQKESKEDDISIAVRGPI